MSATQINPIEQAEALHQRAMDKAEAAFLARLRGESNGMEYTRQAYELEAQAAGMVAAFDKFEPSRSVLHRSAACLAMECGENAQAARLIYAALAGYPPVEIAEELQDLLEDITFRRHLRVKDISLSAGQVQMSLSGNAVSYGTIASREYINRVTFMEKLFLRTGERKSKQPYRKEGLPGKSIRDDFALYLSVPRAASFAVTLKLGGPQLTLPGMEAETSADKVIDEVFDCLRLLQEDEDQLRRRVQDEAYYRNFVALAGKIAPDGVNISTVGFTAIRNGREETIALRDPSNARRLIHQSVVAKNGSHEQGDAPEPITVTGILLAANGLKPEGRITLVDKDRISHSIIVPEGLMADIVKPLWEEKVTVTGIKRNKNIVLEDINPAAEGE